MQASESGFFVHIHHDFGAFEHGVDLRLEKAKVFLSELAAAVAGVERTHLAAVADGPPAEEAPAEEANPDSEETKAAAAAEEHRKRVAAGKKAAETRAKNEAKATPPARLTSRRGKK